MPRSASDAGSGTPISEKSSWITERDEIPVKAIEVASFITETLFVGAKTTWPTSFGLPGIDCWSLSVPRRPD